MQRKYAPRSRNRQKIRKGENQIICMAYFAAVKVNRKTSSAAKRLKINLIATNFTRKFIIVNIKTMGRAVTFLTLKKRLTRIGVRVTKQISLI